MFFENHAHPEWGFHAEEETKMDKIIEEDEEKRKFPEFGKTEPDGESSSNGT